MVGTENSVRVDAEIYGEDLVQGASIAIKYDVTTIPRVLVFKGSDKPLHQVVGLTPEAELAKLLDKALGA